MRVNRAWHCQRAITFTILGKETKYRRHYGQPSCTAGRAAFIMGQLPIRTGMTTIGIPGSTRGIQKSDPTLAEVLKSVGYATAQFGKGRVQLYSKLEILSV